ncbi:MAG: bifunctional riboflavin kinase/FAD synthetase [Desulfovibrionaceae bacterium]
MFNLSSVTDTPSLCAQGTCVTIGNFDGVHMGHRALIQRTCQKAVHNALPCTVLTFWPHPLRVLAGSHAPPLLTSRHQRARLLEQLGVQVCLEMPFDRPLAALSPEDFVRQVLVPLNTRHLIVGYDFSLGKGRMGTADVLEHLGQRYGFAVEQLSPVILQDAVVSSTRIRDLIRQGEVWEARTLLGRFHSINGTVIHGHGRGEGLGFPTANLPATEVLLPRQGVYATWVSVQGVPHAAVTNVGINPTFDGNNISVESFLLDTNINLYEQDIKVSFALRLRDEIRFPNPAALCARIKQDVILARQALSQAENGQRLSFTSAPSSLPTP